MKRKTIKRLIRFLELPRQVFDYFFGRQIEKHPFQMFILPALPFVFADTPILGGFVIAGYIIWLVRFTKE